MPAFRFSSISDDIYTNGTNPIGIYGVFEDNTCIFEGLFKLSRSSTTTSRPMNLTIKDLVRKYWTAPSRVQNRSFPLCKSHRCHRLIFKRGQRSFNKSQRCSQRCHTPRAHLLSEFCFQFKTESNCGDAANELICAADAVRSVLCVFDNVTFSTNVEDAHPPF